MFPDIFMNDAFSVIAMTATINKQPFVPGRIGQKGLFIEEPVSTTSIMIEEKAGTLSLLSPTPRGGPGETIDKPKRTARSLVVPHFQRDDAIHADEVQGVRAFGSSSELETVEMAINARLADHTPHLDATLEYQRIGAVKGIILYADGSTVNLFTEFGVNQESVVDFDLDNAAPEEGAVYKKCAVVTRLIAGILGSASYTIEAIVGDAFWDDLITHPEVVDTFRYQEGTRLRERRPYQRLEYGGIAFENYQGAVGGTKFVADDDAHFYPVGVPGFFKTFFAPADYMETVNTFGLPRYAKSVPKPNNKGVDIEMQSNPLSICTRPNALIKGSRT